MGFDGELTVASTVAVPANVVWERAVTEEGINDELQPDPADDDARRPARKDDR